MKILIVKTSSLGDIIHIFPVIQFIKQTYPDAQVDWVVEENFAELVRSHPLVNKIIPIHSKKWRRQLLKKSTWGEVIAVYRELRKVSYDLVFDLQGNVKSGIATFCSKSVAKIGFGFKSVPEWPNLMATHWRYNPPNGKNIREDYLFIVQSALNRLCPLTEDGVTLGLKEEDKSKLDLLYGSLKGVEGLKILICPGSNWSNKQLSMETWSEFLQCFPETMKPYFIFIWGTQEEKNLAQDVSKKLIHRSLVMDKLSLPALQNLMGRVDLVLAMDSLPLHLAGTTSTPTYSVFGASSANKYGPLGKQHFALQGDCPYSKKFEKRCDVLRTCSTGACMKSLRGRQVFDHFYAWWSSKH